MIIIVIPIIIIIFIFTFMIAFTNIDIIYLPFC